jgi:hypothetical protein
MSSKDTSSNTSSVSDNNMSDKNVTHTDHRSKTKSNSLSNSVTDDYKYIPGADRTKSSTENKRPSSGNIKGM